MSQFCQIEFVSSDSDIGMPCGKPAVAKCGDWCLLARPFLSDEPRGGANSIS